MHRWLSSIVATVLIVTTAGMVPARAAETTLVPTDIPRQALELIKFWEGIVTEKTRDGDIVYPAYRGPGGKWIVCYGHAGPSVKRDSMVLTQEGCETLLRRDLKRFGASIADNVTVPINDNQYAALLSFAYTVGTGNFERSGVLRRLNAGDYAGAAHALTAWDKVTVRGEKRALPGLTKRRAAEKALFLAEVAPADIAEPMVQEAAREAIVQVLDGPVVAEDAAEPEIWQVAMRIGAESDRAAARSLGERLIAIDIGAAGFVEFSGLADQADAPGPDRIIYFDEPDREVAATLAGEISRLSGAGCTIELASVDGIDTDVPPAALLLDLAPGSACLPDGDAS